ncbi:MAG: TonB family protein [candidate division NC10 bacterium]|nr:TonB family protein [candidate division NC10 bacterium]
MAASADLLMTGGPRRKELWLDVALSILVHGLLVTLILFTPRFQVGTYITIPVSYQVDLISATPGSKSGGGSAPTPAAASPPAPVARSAAPPRAVSRPSEELTLPGRQPARKAPATVEPSLRPPAVTDREPSRPAPASPVPMTPQAPTASSAATASTGAGSAKGTGVEVAGPEGSGAGGTTRDYYLTLVDNKIRSNWVAVGGRPEDVVVVKFRVLRSGQVRDIEPETSSGDASLDTSALRAIRQSLPLPPFPNLLTDPSIDLRYRFVLVKNGLS